MRQLLYYRPSHPKADAHGFVDSGDLGDEPQELAINAPILSGRFYEGTVATDGTDIGSRKKHREYMRQNGLTTASDYRGSWAQAEKRQEAVRRGERGALPSKTRREAIARALYKIDKP